MASTPFSPRQRASGIVSLFWSKLGHGMGSGNALALQDIIQNALEDAYDAGRKGSDVRIEEMENAMVAMHDRLGYWRMSKTTITRKLTASTPER